jgi:hypothetical protein
MYIHAVHTSVDERESAYSKQNINTCPHLHVHASRCTPTISTCTSIDADRLTTTITTNSMQTINPMSFPHKEGVSSGTAVPREGWAGE